MQPRAGGRQQFGFDYEITVVGGQRGRQLAAQAESIVQILEWFKRRLVKLPTDPAADQRQKSGDSS